MAYDISYEENITTNEDMLHYKGINLEDEFGPQDDVGNQVKRSINDVELWLIDFCCLNYDFNKTRDDLSPKQKESFKRAVCEQIDYILDNGDLRNLSGVDQETGMVIDASILNKRGISPTAFMILRRVGMCNLRRY